MNKLTIGLVGCGNVGSGVIKFLQKKRAMIREKSRTDFIMKTVCDRSPETLNGLGIKTQFTTNFADILNDPEIDAVIELIGGLHPAREVVMDALKNGKHVITANKELIAHFGKNIFQEAQQRGKCFYYESSVMAGVPSIKTITEGIVGNQITGIYGIINGTCNYILTEMAHRDLNFNQALAEAQKNGFAESNPTLDINGMDSAHKLAILVALTMGKFPNLKDIHTEGITHISHDDIEYAERMDLTIKLLAIAKNTNNEIEARVHPTFISKENPLASINGVYNALYLTADPLGKVLLSGEGAGQMAAASGIISDLINLASRKGTEPGSLIGNIHEDDPKVRFKAIEEISTKFYLRFTAVDKPGVLSQISGILGEHGIGINSVTQKQHNRAPHIPVIMLTDYSQEKMIRQALEKIHHLPVIKAKPVAIRMENL